MSAKLVKRLLQNTSSHDYQQQEKKDLTENGQATNKKRKLGKNTKQGNNPNTFSSNSKESSLKSQIKAILDIDKTLLSSNQTSQTALVQQNIKEKRNITKLRQKINSKQNKHTGVGNSRSSCSKRSKHEKTVTKDIARSQRKMRTIRDVSKALSAQEKKR